MSAQRPPLPRQSERIPAEIPIQLVLRSLFTQKVHSAQTVDISRSGARVRASARMSPGQSVQVVPNEGARRSIEGRIVWVNKVVTTPGGEAGIEFIQP
jgi:PilZ domain